MGPGGVCPWGSAQGVCVQDRGCGSGVCVQGMWVQGGHVCPGGCPGVSRGVSQHAMGQTPPPPAPGQNS